MSNKNANLVCVDDIVRVNNGNQYVCPTCNKLFTYNKNLQYHIKSKVCVKKVQNFVCEDCGKKYANKSSLYRHTKKCKKNVKQNNIYGVKCDANKNNINKLIKPIDDKNKLESTITVLLDELKHIREDNLKLHSEITEMKATFGSTLCNINYNTANTNNTNNNTTNTINNNVTINADNVILVEFGKEDLDRFSSIDKLNILKKGLSITPTYIEKVHLNPKYPEYHNVCIPNKKDNYGLVYQNQDWELRKIRDIQDDMFEQILTFIRFNKDKYNHNEIPHKILSTYCDLGEDCVNKEDRDRFNMIYDDMKLQLINGRKKALMQKKLMEDNKKKIKQ